MEQFYGAFLVLYATGVIALFHGVMAKTCSKYFFFHTRSCIALFHWYIQHRFPYPHSCSSMQYSQPGSYSLLMLRLLLTSVRRGRWWPVLQPSTSSKNSNVVINSNKVIEKLSVSFPQFESQGIASPSLKYYPYLLHYISTRFSHISRCLICICWSMTEKHILSSQMASWR